MPVFSAGVVALLIAVHVQSAAQVNNADGRAQHWGISIFGAVATGEENTNSFAEAQILTGGIYIGRTLNDTVRPGWYHGRWEYGFDVSPIYLQLTPNRIHGIAFDPIIFRWYPKVRLKHATSFLELGGGAVRTFGNFPAGDTSNFNFIARGGGGIQFPRGKCQNFEMAWRWWHISNANLGNRNPEFNGIQMSVAYHWFK